MTQKVLNPCMHCPHCDQRASVRTSRSLSPLYRELSYQCTNVECGHTFKCGLEILCSLSPSAMPKPGIDLPLSTTPQALTRRRLLAEPANPIIFYGKPRVDATEPAVVACTTSTN